MDDRGLAVRVTQQHPIPLDAAFDCAPGEVLALTGPSGSGKSTLLRCIAGLERGAKGSIVCAGRTWLDTKRRINATPQARSVGLVFQHYALFPHLTALGNVVAALGHRPSAGREARARELLAKVHLAGLEHRRPAVSRTPLSPRSRHLRRRHARGMQQFPSTPTSLDRTTPRRHPAMTTERRATRF